MGYFNKGMNEVRLRHLKNHWCSAGLGKMAGVELRMGYMIPSVVHNLLSSHYFKCKHLGTVSSCDVTCD